MVVDSRGLVSDLEDSCEWQGSGQRPFRWLSLVSSLAKGGLEGAAGPQEGRVGGLEVTLNLGGSNPSEARIARRRGRERWGSTQLTFRYKYLFSLY